MGMRISRVWYRLRTHRHPISAVPSLCSLLKSVHQIYFEKEGRDDHTLGRNIKEVHSVARVWSLPAHLCDHNPCPSLYHTVCYHLFIELNIHPGVCRLADENTWRSEGIWPALLARGVQHSCEGSYRHSQAGCWQISTVLTTVCLSVSGWYLFHLLFCRRQFCSECLYLNFFACCGCPLCLCLAITLSSCISIYNSCVMRCNEPYM